MKPQLIHRLKRLPSWLRNRLTPGGLVLTYHRVAELPFDPYGMCVTPARFAEHLEVVRKYGRPMRLRELVGALREGRRPHRAVVVTFDDGYADNLLAAKPLLERHDVPATVFAAAGPLDRRGMFWWDELAALVLRPETLPAALKLTVNGKLHEWELGEAAGYSADAGRSGPDVLDVTDAAPRNRFFRSVYYLLRPLPDGERRKALEELRAWVGPASTADAETCRTLSPGELLELAEGGLVEVGAHTFTHPALSTLPEHFQKEEIRGGKDRLEAALNRPVSSFAYPHGDYSALTVELVRKAGFACACTTQTGVVCRGADPFRLPRLGIGNWGGDEVGKLLRWLALG